MNPYKSPYKRGADDGAWFGICLSLIFITTVLSQSFPLLGMVSLGLMVCVPALVYMALRRSYTSDRYNTTLSALWMQGIMMFLCGSLISGLVSIIYLKWINPGYIHQLILTAIDAYRQTKDAQLAEIADGLQMMIDSGAVPTAPSLVFASIWTSVLTGSILSLIMGLIVRTRHAGRRSVANQQ